MRRGDNIEDERVKYLENFWENESFKRMDCKINFFKNQKEELFWNKCKNSKSMF